MFWVCYEDPRGNKRLSQSWPVRVWIVEAESSPDSPNEYGERPYPFNGMGGFVDRDYTTRAEAEAAKSSLYDYLSNVRTFG